MPKLHISKTSRLSNRRLKTTSIDFNKLNYDQLLDVANAVEMGMRGFQNINVVDDKSREISQKVLCLKDNSEINIQLRKLNSEIVKKNAQISKGKNGRKLYDDLMSNR